MEVGETFPAKVCFINITEELTETSSGSELLTVLYLLIIDLCCIPSHPSAPN
jgi:hypothetical protein